MALHRSARSLEWSLMAVGVLAGVQGCSDEPAHSTKTTATSVSGEPVESASDAAGETAKRGLPHWEDLPLDLAHGPDGEEVQEFWLDRAHIDSFGPGGKWNACVYSCYCTYYKDKSGAPVPHGVYYLADSGGGGGLPVATGVCLGFGWAMRQLLNGRIVISGCYKEGARWGPWTIYGSSGQPTTILGSDKVELPSWTGLAKFESYFLSTKRLIGSIKAGYTRRPK